MKMLYRIAAIVLLGFTVLNPVRAAGPFQDNGDDTVTDSTIGFMWQQDGSTQKNLGDARTYCQNLSLAEYDDWRLPEIFVLSTLPDYQDEGPAIDTAAFSGTQSAEYWSNSSYIHDASKAWTVGFTYGKINTNDIIGTHYVRCVRGGPVPFNPLLYLAATDADRVTDSAIGLVWQRTDDNNLKAWPAAQSYCDNLSLAGHDDWRLPDIDELKRIIDYSYSGNLAFDTVLFSNPYSSVYWSASTYLGGSYDAWIVDFHNGGGMNGGHRTSYHNARCVRAGSGTVEELEPPLISATPGSGADSMTVNFTSTVSGGLDPYSYTWKFGDSATNADTANASHTYSKAGSYTATLIVTGSMNETPIKKETQFTKVTVTVAPEFSLTTNIVSGSGAVTLSPQKTFYAQDESVTLTAAPSACYDLSAWSGACSGAASTCTLAMDADKSVGAAFSKRQYNLVTNAVHGSVGRSLTAATYECGTFVTLVAQAEDGYQFAGWSGASGAEPFVNVTFDSNLNITALFKPQPYCPIATRVSPDGGGIVSSTQEGVMAEAAPGFYFDRWETDLFGAEAYITAATGIQATAVFAPEPAPLPLSIRPQSVSAVLGASAPIAFQALDGVAPYLWGSADGQVTSEGSAGVYYPPAQTGDYSLLLRDAQNNSANASVRVVSVPRITPAQRLLEPGETIQFQVSGGQTPYTWTAEDGGTLSQIADGASYVAPAHDGLYAVTVQDTFAHRSTAIVQVMGDLLVSPARSLTATGETVLLAAARGVPPYTWPDGSSGRSWQTSFMEAGHHEIAVSDAVGNSASAVVEVMHAELSLTPESIYVRAGEAVNFYVSGGTPPYVWAAEAGSLSSHEGENTGYAAPGEPGRYRVIVTDKNGMGGRAEVIVSATPLAEPGLVRSGIIIDGVLHDEGYIPIDDGAYTDISFVLELPRDGRTYNTYAAIKWTPLAGEPQIFFRLDDPLNPFVLIDLASGESLPIYQTASSGENVTVSIYSGLLAGVAGRIDFYLAYVPAGETEDMIAARVFNAIPYQLSIVNY
ncbi:MAG: DUF1566 domain-containing protein [Gammaproteobacteria bacterium]|nr:DUF1566 domain-containing protein [Gammaproteobacteria bacterium]